MGTVKLSRPPQTDCRYEPAYPNHFTVLFTFASDSLDLAPGDTLFGETKMKNGQTLLVLRHSGPSGKQLIHMVQLRFGGTIEIGAQDNE